VTLSLARFAGLAAATVAVVCGLGIWPAWSAAGTDGVVSLIAAACVALVGAIVGYLPFARAADRYEARVQAAMLGVLVRMLATVAIAFGVAAFVPARMPFLIGVGAGYVALLALETFVVLRPLRRREGNGGPASA
jgi:hypothetical protein